MSRSRLVRVVLALSALTYSAFMSAGLPARAGATEIQVTTETDQFGSGKDCALREAVQAANTNTAFGGCTSGSGASPDLIRVPEGHYSLTLTGPGENLNATGDIDITESVEIRGAGKGDTVIDGMGELPGSCFRKGVAAQGVNEPDRVFHIHFDEPPPKLADGPSTQGFEFDVTFRALEVTLGETLDGQGGGILAEVEVDSLNFLNVAVTDNVVFGTSAAGGGIASFAQENSALNLSVIGNVASGENSADGGGFFGAPGGLGIVLGEIVENRACGGQVFGAGLSVGGQFQMASSEVRSNIADGSFSVRGGGIFLTSPGDRLAEGEDGPNGIVDTLIAGNDAFGFLVGGGGLATEGGDLGMVDTWVRNNTTTSFEGKGQPESLGGGIFASGFGDLTMADSTVEGNTAEMQAPSLQEGSFGNGNGTGGGIFSDVETELINSTISDNTAAAGGGLAHFEPHPKSGRTAAARLTHVTITDNSANEGGGILLQRPFQTTSRIRLDSTIVAAQEGGSDCAGHNFFRSLGNNMDSDNTCNLDEPTDHPDTNPQLGPLDNNGGFAPTHALTPSSPPTDSVTGSACPPPNFDQRGVGRPQDGDGNGSERCDIGAFELEESLDFCPGFENDPRNQIIGTGASEVLTGTDGLDIICGLHGNDTIRGKDGNDLLFGGADNDEIHGGAGDDFGEGGGGDDDVFGEGGDDRLEGLKDNDRVVGGGGNDSMGGGDGPDVLIGEEGDDHINAWFGRDEVRGGAGKDRILGSTGDDDMEGGVGADDIRGFQGDDDAKGNEGNDTIVGAGGNDDLHGGPDKDDCFGGGGNNTFTSCENDVLEPPSAAVLAVIR